MLPEKSIKPRRQILLMQLSTHVMININVSPYRIFFVLCLSILLQIPN